MAGANPSSVQSILRHKDSRKPEIYKHLSPGYLRSEVDRLQFNPASSSATANVLPSEIAANAAPFAAPVLQTSGKKSEGPKPLEKSEAIQGLRQCAIVDSNHWPSASETDALSS